MRTRHTTKLVSGGLGLIVLACLWFCFAPVALGGSTSYVVTDGVSMEPRFHSGDLVIVRSQSSYRVGQIVAYHSNVFHTVVLHRIIARDGSHYVFKGDNNNFVDFEHPAQSQLIGALWIHLPGAGARLQSLRSPALVGALVAIGTLLFAGAAFTQRRRRRQRRAAEGARATPAASPQHLAGPVLGVLAVGLVALLPFLALALLAFTRPTSALLPADIPYHQSGALSYSADATPGPAYSGNRAVTGDPLFTHVLSVVDLRFRYRFHTAAEHSLAGSASLYATVSSTSGWQSTLALGARTPFRGDSALVAARLDLPSLLALMRRVEATTAVGGSYTLTISPRVSTAGKVGGAPLHTTFSPAIQFSINQREVQPIAATGSSLAGGSLAGGRPTANRFAQSTSGSATGEVYQPLFLSFKIARLSVATARWIALGGIAAVSFVLLAVLAFARPRRREEPAAIRARYGRMIVPVERVWQEPGVAVIDVSDMDALVRIAERYERSILHEGTPEGDAFWVTDESGQFRYAIGAPAYAVQEPEYTPGTVQEPAYTSGSEVVDPAPIEGLAGEVYADELALGGAISASEARSPSDALVGSLGAGESWASGEELDASTQETDEWRAAWDSTDSSRARSRGAFGGVVRLERS